jgi:dihydropteroate synthase
LNAHKGSPGGFRLMGVVNVTPDSFSDGGLFLDPAAAVAHGLQLAQEGADILDVGGESTRPGAEPVGAVEELRRVLPVVEGLVVALRSRSIHSHSTAPTGGRGATSLSIDTSKASVASAALDAGATLVNDVTALRGDPEMAAVVAQSGAECCLMHMLGEPRTMQSVAGGPRYDDVVDDVRAFLEERLAFAVAEGIAEERVLLDPGIGFGKTLEHNLQLLRRLGELAALGRPLVVGTSRKSFIGRILAASPGVTPRAGRAETEAGDAGSPGAGVGMRAGATGTVDAAARLPGTIATCVLAYERGANVLRVHDVAPVRAALAVAAATLGAR